MIKILLRIILFFTVILTLCISFLSFFGIKTNKFNEIIKTEIIKQDNRLNLNLNSVFIKFNFRQLSFYLNSKNIDFFIQNENQKIANVDILVSLSSLLKKENKPNKIIINSHENEIKSLLKFLRIYKINIPLLYLENSVVKGNITYDIIINFQNNNLKNVQLSGDIINTELNILRKKKIENISLNFNYDNSKLQIEDLNLNYNKINFKSKKITADFSKKLINIKGDVRNNVNSNLVSSIMNYNIESLVDEKNYLPSVSNFDLLLNKNFKLIDYKLDSEINYDKLYINLKKLHLNNFITDFNNEIILAKGSLHLNLNKKEKTKIKLNSDYIFNEKQKPRNISLYYEKLNLTEQFQLSLDLIENEININQINFKKKRNEDFQLNLILNKNKNSYEIENFQLFNDKNKFSINNLNFDKKLKIINFNLIEANFYNNKNFLNNILFERRNGKINIISNQLDISLNLEKILRSSEDFEILKYFKSLNTLINIDIKLAKLDDDHNLINIIGEAEITNNKIDKANISANFEQKGNFIYTKNEIEGKKVTTIFSDLAKPFVKKFKFIKGFEDGNLDYTSTEINEDLSKSELRIYNFKLQNMPALTKLLSLASLQGIADLATGEGIRFNEFDMFFDNSKNLITINEIYALGPAISILMEGYIEKNKLVSLRGTLVPATTINKSIAKIPLLGDILIGDKVGEGVFGVSFKIKGPPNKLDTRVNPIKTLTPRFITRTLEKIKKTN